MKEPYRKGVAIHLGPESCAGDGNIVDEALTKIPAMNATCLYSKPRRASPALLSGNSRLGKFFLDAHQWQLEPHVSRGGRMGSDGASLKRSVDAFVDPMGYRAGDTNLYRYVESNPLGASDPSGLATFNDLLGKRKRRTLSREDFEDWVGHNIYWLTREQRLQLDFGCIGLCAVNQAPDPKHGPYEPIPEKATGTQCYLSEAAAKKRTCQSDQVNFVFAKTGEWRDGKRPTPANDGTIPNNSIVGIGSGMVPDPSDPTQRIYHETSVFNYITVVGGFYIRMNQDAASGPQTVTISRNAPEAGDRIMWCSTCKCKS